jgi:hypothetical protein
MKTRRAIIVVILLMISIGLQGCASKSKPAYQNNVHQEKTI